MGTFAPSEQVLAYVMVDDATGDDVLRNGWAVSQGAEAYVPVYDRPHGDTSKYAVVVMPVSLYRYRAHSTDPETGIRSATIPAKELDEHAHTYIVSARWTLSDT